MLPPLAETQHRQGERRLGPDRRQDGECRRDVAIQVDQSVVGRVDGKDVLAEAECAVVGADTGTNNEEDLDGATG